MPVIFNCPSCRQRLSVSRRKKGEQVQCPACSSYVVVPPGKRAAPPHIEFPESHEPETPPLVTFAPAGKEPLTHFEEEVEDRLEDIQPSEESEHPPASQAVSTLEVPESRHEEVSPAANAIWIRPNEERREPPPPIPFRRANDEFEEMDLTPMVDVTFLLLIFFMLTASFSLEKTIPTPVPDPNDQSASQPIQQQDDLLEKSIMIAIDSNNKITIDDEPLADAALLRDRLTELMRREKKAEAIVTVADLAMQESVVYVLDTANEVGMSKIRLAAGSGGPD